MEQFLTVNNNKVDAVVASNDGTAGGVVAALAAQGLAGSVAGLRSGRRPRRAEPRRARHPDRVGLEGRARARQEGRRDRSRARRRQGAWTTSTAPCMFDGGPKGVDMNVAVPRARADHQGQPQRRHRRRLDHQGRRLPGRAGRHRRGLRLTPDPNRSRAAAACDAPRQLPLRRVTRLRLPFMDG